MFGKLRLLCVCVFVAASNFGNVRGDLPVHCLVGEVVGTWTFKFGPVRTEKDTSCGHDQPDAIFTMPNDKIGFDNPGFPTEKTETITLKAPNKAVDESGNEGTWTMVYDEGFDIHIQKRHLFTFFKYVPKVADPDKAEVHDFTSFCDETVSGWHSSGESEHSCFVAKKQAPKAILVDRKTLKHDPCPVVVVGVLSPSQHDGCSTPRFRATEAALEEASNSQQGHATTRERVLEMDQLFHSDHAFIDRVNADKTATWTAKAHGHLEGKSMNEIRNMLGHQRFQEVEASTKPHSHKVVAIQPVNVLTVEKEHEHGFPQTFDWRTIDGGVYMTPVAEQGGCGSCYAVASTDVATMRYRIKHGKTNKEALKKIFSAQNVVGCSRVNQGCDGGYPYLVGMHGVEFGFVPLKCQDYTGDNQCKRECLSGDDVVRSKSYSYIGGYYGADNEKDMLEALKRGPIVLAVNAPPDLLYYSHGVYSEPLDRTKDAYALNGITRWEKTNHAIACVGWGEEVINGERVKYWIAKNSWGARWGDNGYFYLRRGTDAIAVESMAVEIKL